MTENQTTTSTCLIVKVTHDQFRFSVTDHLSLPLVSINTYFSTSLT